MIIEYVRRIAEEIIGNDPDLDSPENQVLKSELIRLYQTGRSWRQIS
jgi:hypothetical protein